MPSATAFIRSTRSGWRPTRPRRWADPDVFRGLWRREHGGQDPQRQRGARGDGPARDCLLRSGAGGRGAGGRSSAAEGAARLLRVGDHHCNEPLSSGRGRGARGAHDPAVDLGRVGGVRLCPALCRREALLRWLGVIDAPGQIAEARPRLRVPIRVLPHKPLCMSDLPCYRQPGPALKRGTCTLIFLATNAGSQTFLGCERREHGRSRHDGKGLP